MPMLWISLRLPLPLAACPGLQEYLFRHTPRLAMLESRVLALDVTGSLALFGGPRALWRRILTTCPPGTQAGMAPTAWGAALLAGQARGQRRALRPATLQRCLDTLPCAALTTEPTTGALLDGWGCRTLGQLRRLPRAGLAQRGLAALLTQIDRAYHPDVQGAAWMAPALAFEASREPDFRGTGLAAVETALIPLLEALCGYLQAHQAATDRIELILHHDARRSPIPQTHILLLLTRPQWDLDTCQRLCRLRIESLALPGPVLRITLRCAHVQPRTPLPASLLPDTCIDRQRTQRLLDVLQARLGTGCLRFPKLGDWPLPEYAESWATRHDPAPSVRPGPRPRWPDSRPLWLLPAPAQLDTHQDQPIWQGMPLQLLSGPERIEGGWWRALNTRRDYFTACDPHAVRYWIYHDLKSGGWFLHGLFA